MFQNKFLNRMDFTFSFVNCGNDIVVVEKCYYFWRGMIKWC